MKRKTRLPIILLAVALVFSACVNGPVSAPETAAPNTSTRIDGRSSEEGALNAETEPVLWYDSLPPYTGQASIPVHDGIPFFQEEELTTDAFEEYADLDSLGRCGAAYANICLELMPTEERGSIGSVRPTGWHTVKYDVIADRYLYNRCHLIGYQLAGENANEKNLITGTRYLNVEGMLPWENLVAAYVEETGHHVLYRVTPCFEGDNLVASGVLMEAYSVEDNGAGICFNVYCYNVQPGIAIDYATGESAVDESWVWPEEALSDLGYDYVLNTNTKRFHDPSCSSVQEMSDKNKEYFSGARESLIEEGYIPCGRCNP